MSVETVGEKVDRDGPCVLMVKVCDLAQKHGRVPVGEWDYTFASDPKWRLCMNGGPHDSWSPEEGIDVPRFEVYVQFNGWPAALFNTAGGQVIGISEDEIVAAFEKELRHV